MLLATWTTPNRQASRMIRSQSSCVASASSKTPTASVQARWCISDESGTVLASISWRRSKACDRVRIGRIER